MTITLKARQRPVVPPPDPYAQSDEILQRYVNELPNDLRNQLRDVAKLWIPAMLASAALPTGKQMKKKAEDLISALDGIKNCKSMLGDLEVIHAKPRLGRISGSLLQSIFLCDLLAERRVERAVDLLSRLASEWLLNPRPCGNQIPPPREALAFAIVVALKESNVHVSADENNVAVRLIEDLVKEVEGKDADKPDNEKRPGGRGLVKEALHQWASRTTE